MARWDNENLIMNHPDCEKIRCKDCFLREKDTPELGIKGATLGVCGAYSIKPTEILFDGEDCPYYIDENEEDEEDEDESD